MGIEIGRFERNGQVVIGCRRGDKVNIISPADNLPEVLGAPDEWASKPGAEVPLSELTVLPPIDPAGRVFAVAVNYGEHGKEAKYAPPPRPLIFYKAPTNFVGHGGALNPNSALTAKFDYEGEVAVVIGKKVYQCSADDALDAVVGICALNDGSARDLTVLQTTDKPWIDWLAAKGLDGASAMGPWIVCDPGVRKSLADGSIEFVTRLNGEVVQRAFMREMIFDTAQIIKTLSSYLTLMPGDVIATGTPAGVGMGTGRFLQSGDRLEVQILGQDPLQVTVR